MKAHKKEAIEKLIFDTLSEKLVLDIDYNGLYLLFEEPCSKELKQLSFISWLNILNKLEKFKE